MKNEINLILQDKQIEKSNNDEELLEIYDELNKMMLDNFNKDIDININNEVFFIEKNNEMTKYKLKDLQKICNYYDIKSSGFKKEDLMSLIVYFESLPENAEIVNRRYTMWYYISELLNDTKMKQYIYW